MNAIDELYMKYPVYGSRRMTVMLNRDDYQVNRKRVQRLMRLMGLEAIYQKPRTSISNSEHRVYPYLLRNREIVRPNEVWCTDITYIRLQGGFVYLVAIMDWFSRLVLSWEVSNTLDTAFCIEALERALRDHPAPEIFNSDQGSQFTSSDFTEAVEAASIKISMDGRGRFLDNIFIERLWRSLKYENIFLKGYGTVPELLAGLEQWFGEYNNDRPHQALENKTPLEYYEQLA